MAKKKKKRLYDRLQEKKSLLMSESHLVTMIHELVQQMMITGLAEKSINGYVTRMDGAGWNEDVIEEVIWDIGEELASQDEKVLNNYLGIQEWLYEVETASKNFNAMQKAQGLDGFDTDQGQQGVISFRYAPHQSRNLLFDRMQELLDMLTEQEYTSTAIKETLVVAATDQKEALDRNLTHILGKKQKVEFRRLVMRVNASAKKFWQMTIDWKR